MSNRMLSEEKAKKKLTNANVITRHNPIVISCNSVVIIQRQDYLEKMNDILSDQEKFSKVSLKDDTLLNCAINQEKHVDKVLKNFVESKSMTEKTRKSLKPVGTRPRIMYS